MALQRIGITCSAAMGVTQPIAKVGRCYVDGVARAGALPLVLPALEEHLAPDAVAGLDGLVLTGGADLDPATYGAAAEPECGPPDAGRDRWELALVAAARAAGIPVLGICRGAQVLNVAFGGTLVQHLPGRSVEGHDDLERAADEVHDVAIADGTQLRQVIGADVVRANTLHHQSVDQVGVGLIASGVADDGVIEAIEAPGEPVLGVQWHPELLLDRPPHQRLFSWVVDPGGRLG